MNNKTKDRHGSFSPYRMLVAVAIPLAAFALQSAFWAAIRPYVWFLFFPAVFFSSWAAGFSGGLVATVLSTLLVWWYFIPPTHTFALESSASLFSIAMFAFMGVLFSISHDRLRKANQQAAEALSAVRSANEELHSAKQNESARLAAAVTHTADVVVITNAEGDIGYANPAFEEVTGYRLDEVRGKNSRLLKSGNHDRAYYEDMWRTIKAGRVWRGKIINRKKDGSLYEEEMSISPITDAAGAIVNFVAVKRDITREAALQKSRAYFTDITAHELRTPLAKLHLVENLLKQIEAAGSDAGSIGEVHSALRDSMNSFDRIVNAAALISDMTRIGAERPFAMDFIYYDITTALENAQGNIGEERRNIRMETDMAELPRHAAVLGNRVMIQQALDEVLSNAIKYTPDGKSIIVRAYSSGGLVHIEVADEGEGIPEDKLRDVLIPYYSLENSLHHSTGRYKFHGGGLGLGLTVAKRIMEYHNGTITIGNRTDCAGTLVVLTFPLAAKDITPDEKPSEPATTIT